MKKFSILVIACALAIGAAACSKKSSTPATTPDTTNDGAGEMGGDAYGGAGGEMTPPDTADPCAGNPCGG